MDGKQKISTTLRSFRISKGLSQRELANLAGVPQPTIAAIESAQREPSLTLLSSIIEAGGGSLCLEVRPLARYGVLTTAIQIREVLKRNVDAQSKNDAALRHCISFQDFISSSDADEFCELINDPPILVGDSRWDSFLAAIVENECSLKDVSPPKWINDGSRFLKPFWHLSSNPLLHDWEFATSPAAFLRHGVIVAADELASV